MSNVLTDWRVFIQTKLGTTFPAAEILPGERTGLSRDKDRACVFTAPWAAAPGDVNNANPKLTVRYWKAKPRISGQTANVPPDPAPIEQLMVDLMTMFQPILAPPGLTVSGLAYFHVDSIEPDVNDEYGVEVQLTGWMRNPAETGG